MKVWLHHIVLVFVVIIIAMSAVSVVGKAIAMYSVEDLCIVPDAADAFEWDEMLVLPIENTHSHVAHIPIKAFELYNHLLPQPFQSIVVPPPKHFYC